MIEESLVIELILHHRGLWVPHPRGQRPPEEKDWPANRQIPLVYATLPAIADRVRALTQAATELNSSKTLGNHTQSRQAATPPACYGLITGD